MDLSKLDDAAFEKLSVEIESEKKKRTNVKRDKILVSNKFTTLKSNLAELNKEYLALAAEFSKFTDASITINLKLKPNKIAKDVYEAIEMGEYEIFNDYFDIEVCGKLSGEYNDKKALKEFNNIIEESLADVCEDILLINPELYGKIKSFLKKSAKLGDEAINLNVVGDLR